MKIENIDDTIWHTFKLCTNLPSLTLNLEILLMLMMNTKQNEIKIATFATIIWLHLENLPMLDST